MSIKVYFHKLIDTRHIPWIPRFTKQTPVSPPPTSFHTLGSRPLSFLSPTEYSLFFQNILAKTDGCLLRTEIPKRTEQHMYIYSHQDNTGISEQLVVRATGGMKISRPFPITTCFPKLRAGVWRYSSLHLINAMGISRADWISRGNICTSK